MDNLVKYLSVILLLTITLACMSIQASAEPNPIVDTDVVIFANGNIQTMNADQPTASAMAIKDGKIIAIGELASVKKTVGDSYEYVDLEGKTVVPGFIESHDHLVQYGAVLEFLDITPFSSPSLKEALQKLKLQGKPDEDGWIYAWAIDQTLYEEKRGPTIEELDALFPDLPVFIFHMSGHAAYVNSKALEIAGITCDLNRSMQHMH